MNIGVRKHLNASMLAEPKCKRNCLFYMFVITGSSGILAAMTVRLTLEEACNLFTRRSSVSDEKY